MQTVSNLVCGDAYLIDGQSNALATDTGEEAPPGAVVGAGPAGAPRAQDHHALEADVDDVERGEVPVQSGVPILQLVAHQHDLAARVYRVGFRARAEVVTALTAARRRP